MGRANPVAILRGGQVLFQGLAIGATSNFPTDIDVSRVNKLFVILTFQSVTLADVTASLDLMLPGSTVASPQPFNADNTPQTQPPASGGGYGALALPATALGFSYRTFTADTSAMQALRLRVRNTTGAPISCTAYAWGT